MNRLLVLATVLSACGGRPPPPPPPIVQPPVRGAAGDADLRTLLADVATAKACDRIRNHFHALRAAARHDIVVGELWIRECKTVHDGDSIKFAVSGSGWEWVDKESHEAGGTFAVHQYVRFNATATITGALDLGYDSDNHVASLWFSPAHEPVVELDPIGGVEVSKHGAWSSVVGTVASAFRRSPASQGISEAKREGTHQFMAQLAEGLTVTVALCTGVIRSTVGHLKKGEVAPPDVLEPSKTELELQPGGVLMLGPQRAPDGMTVHVDAPGQIEVSLACVEDAEAVATAYLAGAPLPTVKPLASAQVAGATELKIGAARCPVAVIARSLATTGGPIAFTVQRSSSEIGWSNGGPIVRCSK